jgi:hypothetical protein
MNRKPSVFSRNPGRLLLVGMALALFFFSSLAGIEAGEGTQLVFDPPAATLGATTVTVAVRVEEVANLYGLQLNVYFDPTVVMVESIAPGDFLSADFVVQKEVDALRGIASLAYTQLAPQTARSGSGSIAILTLRRTPCAGHSALKLANVILSNRDGQAIAHTLSLGETSSGQAPLERQIRGSLFHDLNEDGLPTEGEPPLVGWPIFVQRLAVDPIGPERVVFSQAGGVYQFEETACGRYQLWSQNGEQRILTRTVDLLATSDLEIPALPVTGTLAYPGSRLFLPALAR